MAVSYSGELGTKIFVAITVKHGLLLYNATKMKPNRMWTPKAMMAKASEITGMKFRTRDYLKAAEELALWIEENAPKAKANGEIK